MKRDSQNNHRPYACMLGYFIYDGDTRVHNYVNFLLKEGYSVDVFCLGKKIGISKDEAKEGVSVITIKKREETEKSRISYIFNLIVFFVMAMISVSYYYFKRRYKFIHVHNLPDILVFTAWIPQILGSRIILDIHDIFPELYARKFKCDTNGVIFRLLLYIEKVSCKFADHVIIANDVWREIIINRAVPTEKCTSIPNFPDREIFSPNGKSVFHQRNASFTMVYHGSYTEHHGLDIAIKAAGILRDIGKVNKFRLLLFGGGPFESDMKSLTQSLGLEDHVFINGPVPVHEIPKILKDADIGIVPKKDGLFVGDALSTKLFEYAAMGIPAVVSRTRAEQRYFNEREVKYFTPENPDDMAKCILELYQNPSLRFEMAQRALRKVDEYSIKANAGKYMDIINRLMIK